MAYRAKQDTYEGKRVPIYKQIYAVLHKEIDEGLYNEDYRLPSEKELTERFHVERNTVRKSLQMLVDEGIVVKIPGYGSKVVSPEDPSPHGAKPVPDTGHCILLATQEDYLQNSDGEYFHFKLIKSFERALSNLGYTLIFKFIEKEEDLRNTILHTSPSAIIFDSYIQPPIYQEALRLKIPCVSVNHYTPLMTSIVSNNFDGAYQVAKMLVEAGHEKIAVVAGKRNYQTSIERLSGVQKLYMQKRMVFDPKYLFTGNWKFQSGVEIGEKILAMPKEELPTAVFAFNDDMAFGCLSCFEKHGLSVPEDISIVGFDKTDRYQVIFRPITTVDVNIDALVEYTCWYLSGRINNSAPLTNAKIDIDAVMIDNGTVRNIAPQGEEAEAT